MSEWVPCNPSINFVQQLRRNRFGKFLRRIIWDHPLSKELHQPEQLCFLYHRCTVVVLPSCTIVSSFDKRIIVNFCKADSSSPANETPVVRCALSQMIISNSASLENSLKVPLSFGNNINRLISREHKSFLVLYSLNQFKLTNNVLYIRRSRHSQINNAGSIASSSFFFCLADFRIGANTNRIDRFLCKSWPLSAFVQAEQLTEPKEYQSFSICFFLNDSEWVERLTCTRMPWLTCRDQQF